MFGIFRPEYLAVVETPLEEPPTVAVEESPDTLYLDEIDAKTDDHGAVLELWELGASTSSVATRKRWTAPKPLMAPRIAGRSSKAAIDGGMSARRWPHMGLHGRRSMARPTWTR